MKIESVVKPLIEGQGLMLYDLEFIGRTLRVTIHKSGGVSISDCSDVSRLLDTVLDVEEVIPGGAYDLEVTSPGLERSLKRKDHFETAVGETVNVVTEEPMSNWNADDRFFSGRKHLLGKLESVGEDFLKMSQDGHSVQLPLAAVKRAQVKFEVVKGQKRKRD